MPEDPPAWVLDQRRALGDRIRAARNHADLRQERLAERVGVDRRTIQGIEAGRSDPRYGWLLLIAAACGTTVPELLAEQPPPTSGTGGPAGGRGAGGPPG